jgi:uncharacterized protein YbjT (DUF2867 family)
MDPIAVTAATGKTGRRVAARLTDRGASVRPLTRATGFDWTAPMSWPAAVAGLHGLYLAYSPDLVVPGAVETVAAFARVAADAGVERVVLLSGRGEAEARAAEEAVRTELPDVTVVRAAWFVQNLTEGDFADSVAHGQLALPVGDVPEPFVDAGDVADVAVAALLDARHAGATYEVTGARSLTFAELTATLGATYVELTPEQARAAWTEAGLPEEVVWLLTTLFGTLFDGRNSAPADGVRRALGREPRDVDALLAGA